MRITKEIIVGTFVLVSISAFLYMGYKIDFFKFDKASYIAYYVNFANASGLTKKADVRIAGVKVGWVDSFNLSDSSQDVIAKIMILSKYQLGIDTQAYIKQDGIFSIKFIELIPGKRSDIILKEGQFLNKDLSSPQPTLEDLILSVNKVLNETLQVTNSLKNIFVDKEIIYKIKDSLESVSSTTKLVNNFIIDNQEKIESIIKNIYKLSSSVPNIIENTDNFISKISNNTGSIFDNFSNLPALSALNLNDSSVIKKNYSYLKPPNNVSDLNVFNSNCINNKESLIKGVKDVISGTQLFINNFNNVTLGVDNNYQYFLGTDSHKNFESLLNFWVHPNNRYYFLAGATFSKDGVVKQRTINFTQDPKHGLMLDLGQGKDSSYDIYKRKSNAFLFNVQTGGYFGNYFGARVGLFRSTPGFALDFYTPVFKDKFKLVSTLEAFDFTGKNHFIKDNKPQLRFINRLYFAPNCYLSFGANDFISRKNLSGFFGVGLDFGDTFFRS